jgi:polyhydroxyalkanoate synthase subunit PhaC
MTTASVTVTAADVAAPLDLLSTDAAPGPLRRFNPGGAGLRLAAALAARPGLVAGRSPQLLGELSRIAAGTSAVAPSRRDRLARAGWPESPHPPSAEGRRA